MIVNVDTDEPHKVPIKDAATVMLVRDGRDGLEVFMLRRNLASDFVGGAYVFPGGGVDLADASSGLAKHVVGRDDADASRRIGVRAGGLAFWVAAIRETFEESGYLLASGSNGATLELVGETAQRFEGLRREVDRSELTMEQLCEAEQLRLDLGAMHYFSRWVTPLGAPRRYDTRFFVAHPPLDQEPTHDDKEVIANLWIRPTDALARHAEGDFELIFPTVRSLEALCAFDSAEAAVASTAQLGAVDPIVPTITTTGDGMLITLQNGETYDAATSQRIE